MNYNKLEIISNIWPDIDEGKLLLFIGAGLSKNAGSFDWKGLTEELLNHPLIKSKTSSCDSKQPYEVIIDYCKSILVANGHSSAFWSAVRRSILRDHILYIDKYLPLVQKIAEINPLPSIVTTNFDPFLEETQCFDFGKIYYKIQDFKNENITAGCVFHIHGYIERLEDALITKTQYLDLYKKASFKKFINYIYKTYNILFIGYNLGDEDLKNVFFTAAKESKRDHYALMPDDHGISDMDKNIYLEKYNINIIEYGSVDMFPEALKYLIDEYISANKKITAYEFVGEEVLDAI